MNSKHSASQSAGKKTGSSLVEVIVALAIFAVFITGACKVLMAHRQLVDGSRDHYTAVNIARNQVEHIRNTMTRIGFDQIFDNEESAIQVASNGEVSPVGKFRRSTQITEINDGLAEIEITVEILDRKKMTFDTKKEVLKTYLARPLARSAS